MNKENYIFNFLSNFNLNNEIKNNSHNLLNYKNIPTLVSNNTKNYISSKLKECNINKFNTNSFYFNLCGFLFFIITLSIILLFKYKGFNKEKNNKKKLQEKQYIMSKLIYYNRQNLDNRNRIKNNLITQQSDINNHPEASLLHRKIYF